MRASYNEGLPYPIMEQLSSKVHQFMNVSGVVSVHGVLPCVIDRLMLQRLIPFAYGLNTGIPLSEQYITVDKCLIAGHLTRRSLSTALKFQYQRQQIPVYQSANVRCMPVCGCMP